MRLIKYASMLASKCLQVSMQVYLHAFALNIH